MNTFKNKGAKKQFYFINAAKDHAFMSFLVTKKVN